MRQCIPGGNQDDHRRPSPGERRGPARPLDYLPARRGTSVRRPGSARPNEKAVKPAYVLAVDFGPLGIKQSSAQLTENYSPEALVGRQVLAVLNFPPKRVAGVVSEVLVLGAVPEGAGVVLLGLERPVPDGTRIA